MSEFDAELERQGPHHRRCEFCKLVETLTPTQTGELDKALADRKYPATVIARVVGRWTDRLVKAKDIIRHRPFGVQTCAAKFPGGKPQ